MQLTFEDLPRHGGRRAGAGRKRGRKVAHGERPVHKWWNPVHVTLRARRALPSFRTAECLELLQKVVRDSERDDFRITEYSLQVDHVHLLVEAQDERTLSMNMRSVVIRLARRLNLLWHRSGPVWADRYHRTDLATPMQVRRALVYVIQNYRKHFEVRHGRPRIDGFSSALWFDGWISDRTTLPSVPRPTALARTKLLTVLWKKHGLLHPGERPTAAR